MGNHLNASDLWGKIEHKMCMYLFSFIVLSTGVDSSSVASCINWRKGPSQQFWDRSSWHNYAFLNKPLELTVTLAAELTSLLDCWMKWWAIPGTECQGRVYSKSRGDIKNCRKLLLSFQVLLQVLSMSTGFHTQLHPWSRFPPNIYLP